MTQTQLTGVLIGTVLVVGAVLASLLIEQFRWERRTTKCPSCGHRYRHL
ncbi:hypothetical protein [Kitasatospora acidiphila]|nr:hypothetical protein [Kitasatospora acidiphila]